MIGTQFCLSIGASHTLLIDHKQTTGTLSKQLRHIKDQYLIIRKQKTKNIFDQIDAGFIIFVACCKTSEKVNKTHDE